jgi:hypothetical protein
LVNGIELGGCKEKMEEKEKEKVEVEIFVDKEEIGTNEFVQNVMGRAIAGAVSALKGVKEDWKEMEIRVRKK